MAKKKKMLRDLLESKIEWYNNYINFLKPEVRMYDWYEIAFTSKKVNYVANTKKTRIIWTGKYLKGSDQGQF
jgi:hypothetical protein